MTIVGSNRLLGYPRFIAAMLVGAVTLAGATALGTTAAQAGATYSATATAEVLPGYRTSILIRGRTAQPSTSLPKLFRMRPISIRSSICC